MKLTELLYPFAFLPVCLVLYYVLPKRCRNAALLAASLLFFAWGTPEYLVLLVLAGAGVFPAGKPSSDAVAVALIGVFFFLVGALEAFFPRVTWAIEQFRMSFWINGAEDAEPSDFYFAARRVTVLLSVAAGLMAIALLLYGLLQTPEPVPDAAELFRQMTDSRKAEGWIASQCRFFML